MARVAIIAATLLLCIGCGARTTAVKSIPAPTVEPGWTEFKSDADRFSVDLPPGWTDFDLNSPRSKAAMDKVVANNPQIAATIQSALAKNQFALTAGDVESAKEGYMNTLNVVHKTGMKIGVMDDQATKDFRRGLESTLPATAHVTSVTKETLPIGDAFKARVALVLTMPNGTKANLVTISYMIPNKNEAYNLAVATTESREAKIAPLFKKVADSFRVIQ